MTEISLYLTKDHKLSIIYQHVKTIGLLGGMSWESSIEYYRIINQEVKKRLGGTNSAKIIMNSVNFEEVETLQHQGKWDDLTQMMIEESLKIQKAEADFLVICTNTMHLMANDIEKVLSIPILHIADATAELIKSGSYNTIALLGTKFTMEEDFYKGRLENNFHLNVMIPKEKERDTIHRIIYDELVLGEINLESKQEYIRIIDNLKDNGAEGVILGCTEIGLLVTQKDTSLAVFDTTRIHALSAVELALQ